MFNTIRESARITTGFYDVIGEATENTPDEVKNLFLDDPRAALVGAEDDPEIAKFVDSIPTDDPDANDATEKDVKDLVESMDYFFESYDSESDSAIYDRITGEGCSKEGCAKEADELDEPDDLTDEYSEDLTESLMLNEEAAEIYAKIKPMAKKTNEKFKRAKTLRKEGRAREARKLFKDEAPTAKVVEEAKETVKKESHMKLKKFKEKHASTKVKDMPKAVVQETEETVAKNLEKADAAAETTTLGQLDEILKRARNR